MKLANANLDNIITNNNTTETIDNIDHIILTQQKSLEFYKTLRNCKDNYISNHVNNALDILSDALRLFGPTQLFSSYNGGKDADVIMHLLRAVSAKFEDDLNTKSNDGNSNPNDYLTCRPKLVYFAIEDEFDEVMRHVHQTEQLYGLEVIRYDCKIVEVRYL